ncbi:hypothetical protein BVF91_11530 [Thermoanaerobacterium sp. PSU-2]|uniref:hypothetical protein n=1 Tax=Thermoanaerobacterium sp. PSU-2 TaxID=1930849 RepID=UPI000A149E1E|nr:hypothetical protein [Thermoanaerobacterium sp. PSU-2]ORX22464.1 hypothetical protein BVF91_11530 [Thermoanaerobacterium sp. PSU-2]
MSKYVEVKFSNDIWSDGQITAYEVFKEELENQGLVINVASEFMDDEDILEVNQNIPDVERLIFELAGEYNLKNNVDIYETYKYDIIRTIKEYGLPRIINNFNQILSLSCEEDDTPQNIIDAFADAGIDLDEVNVAGQWGGKMVWVINGQIFTATWTKEEE